MVHGMQRLVLEMMGCGVREGGCGRFSVGIDIGCLVSGS